ncbi:hypothetical protein MIND_01320800 [Mycena indigotica]|uniref:Uncharacterized protein n=1 Tax=Mycena indigotica TaxID=2126181 RepID=A0A8H6S1W2_9AGAR|nr:uncharacterized protein MIND_01320800 [Mycena indigotica]KAF7290798.1 hypothetical protein MIND_01320800 [Mycena indigotica]
MAGISALVECLTDDLNDAPTLFRALTKSLSNVSALAKTQTIGLVGLEGYEMLYKKLPWHVVEEFMVRSLEDDQSDGRRRGLIRLLHRLEVDSLAPGWCGQQAIKFLDFQDPGDTQWLLETLVSDVPSFIDNVIPVLESRKLSQFFWVTFIRTLRQESSKFGGLEQSKSSVDKLVCQCLHIIIHNLNAFPSYTTCYPAGDNMTGKQNLLKIFELCRETDNMALTTLIMSKMRRAASEMPNQDFKQFFLVLVPLAIEVVTSTDDPSLRFHVGVYREFLVNILDAILQIPAAHSSCQSCELKIRIRPTDSTSSQPDGPIATPGCDILNDDNVSTILLVVQKLGGIENLNQFTTAFAKHKRVVVENFARAVAARFKPLQKDPGPEHATYDRTMSSLIASDKTVQSLSREDLLDYLRLCVDVGAVTRFKTLLDACQSHRVSDSIQLLPGLSERMCQDSESVRLFSPAFGMFSRHTLKSWATRLNHCRTTIFKQLLAFGCLSEGRELSQCEHGCLEVRKFMIDDWYTSCTLNKRKSESRKHVELYLELLKCNGAGSEPLLIWRTDVSSRPHTLVITKTSHQLCWNFRRQIAHAKGHLSTIGPLEARRILGTDHDFIVNEIETASWPKLPVDAELPMCAESSTANKRPANAGSSEGPAAKRARSEMSSNATDEDELGDDSDADSDWRPESRSKLH